MKQTTLSNGKKVSAFGIGGHYKHFEYGRFEETYGPVEEKEVKERAGLLQKAVEMGITYFDTTWYNEVEMLAKSLALTDIPRDKLHINGMVLGAFRGAAGFEMEVEAYFEKYLDKRLKMIQGNHFDSFMINAIEEQYDSAKCERLVRLLEKRRDAGDIGMIGFSCHNHPKAREIADEFPQFEIIMTAYNFRNRWFEKSFDGYTGKASFVAMKPLVWAQYGIAFSVINSAYESDEFKNRLGFEPDQTITTQALQFPSQNPMLNVTIASVNTQEELAMLTDAGTGSLAVDDALLSKYDKAIESDRGKSLFLGGLRTGMQTGNVRLAFFCADNLCRILEIDKTGLSVRDENRHEVLKTFCEKIYGSIA